MSAFSEYLSGLISERNTKVSSLYRFCEVDRSTMYQYISGKRKVPPSIELVNKIAEFFHLTPMECDRLREAYLISKTGDEIYYRRKSVENFIVNFPDPMPKLFEIKQREMKQHGMRSLILEAKENRDRCVALSTQIEMNHYLHQIILKEAMKENGEIALFVQPDYSFLFDLLSSFKPADSLRIEHIVCLSSAEQMNEKKGLYTLEYLKVMFPLYMADLDYQPYYFYDNIHSHFENLNGLSYLILTSEYAITCTSDYQMGILYDNPDAVAMFWTLFRSYKHRCTELFLTRKFTATNKDALLSPIKKEESCYVLQPESCLTAFVTEEILRNVLNPDLPDYEELIQLALKMFGVSREVVESNNAHIFFTKKGLEQFIRTGRIKEIPDVLYSSLSSEDRAKILRSMLPFCKLGSYRILKEGDSGRNLIVPGNFHICVNGNFGYLIFTNISGQNVGLIICEHGLLGAFEDYLENFDESHFMTVEDTVSYVEDSIRCLENPKKKCHK